MKVDNLWVKWIHTYYLKGCDVMTDLPTNNCTWIFKQIMARKVGIGNILQIWNNMVAQGKFQMMKVYNALTKESNGMDWYHIMNHNIAKPRAKVIMWLVCQERLPIKNRLNRVGMLQHTNCEFL